MHRRRQRRQALGITAAFGGARAVGACDDPQGLNEEREPDLVVENIKASIRAFPDSDRDGREG